MQIPTPVVLFAGHVVLPRVCHARLELWLYLGEKAGGDTTNGIPGPAADKMY